VNKEAFLGGPEHFSVAFHERMLRKAKLFKNLQGYAMVHFFVSISLDKIAI